MGYLLFGGICFCLGVFSAWVWLTEFSPFAKKTADKEYGVQVRCSHCGRMYRTGFNNVRTANFCSECE
jgi:hypothetical protein